MDIRLKRIIKAYNNMSPWRQLKLRLLCEWWMFEVSIRGTFGRKFVTHPTDAAPQPLILGDRRESADPPRVIGRRTSDFIRRWGNLPFNGLVSAVTAVPLMFFGTEHYAILGSIIYWLLIAGLALGGWTLVMRRENFDRPTAMACLVSIIGAWCSMLALTRVFEPNTLSNWEVWGVAFGLAFCMALILVSGLALLVNVVMAYLPRTLRER